MRLMENASAPYEAAAVLTIPSGGDRARMLCSELRARGTEARPIVVEAPDPSDYGALFRQLGAVVDLVREEFPVGSWHRDVLLSSGTPQAQTLWVVLVQAGLLPARMLQVIPPSFVPVPHPHPVREVRLDVDGFPTIQALQEEVVRLRTDQVAGRQLIGDSGPWRALVRRLARAASASVPMLVTGETGTGKELVARAIHAGSERRNGPFIAENCGALSEGVLASELFGHDAGAFTGAQKRHRGLFEQAHGGTLFLDEVGEMPARVQASLLRVLQEGEFRPVGSERTVRVDVRVVAATHRHLPDEVAAGRFREDLYYRLHGATLALPPLRERPGDIPLLIAAFLKERASRLELTRDALEALERYSWPGNVRELRSEVVRWTVFCDRRVTRPDLSEPVLQGASEAPARQSISTPPAPSASPTRLADVVARAEIVALRHALEDTNGNLSAAARRLGIDRNTLKRKLARHGLGPHRGAS